MKGWEDEEKWKEHREEVYPSDDDKLWFMRRSPDDSSHRPDEDGAQKDPFRKPRHRFGSVISDHDDRNRAEIEKRKELKIDVCDVGDKLGKHICRIS